jgi:lipoprotein-anchoring transpeptidase ErfK/SrfK
VKNRKPHRYLARAFVVILLASAVTACGGNTDESSPTPSDVAAMKKSEAMRPTTTTTTTAPPPCRAGEVKSVGSSARAFAAVVQERAVAFRKPGRRGFAEFGSENANGVPMVLGVLAKRVDASCRATWYRVQLPLKPNGVTGWVRVEDVELAPVTTRIVVDLSQRRVTLLDKGREVLSTRAAIGASATPTPTGRYYVNQRLVPSDPGGPYGPGAIGISASSEVLTGWTQGGPIAIHGTNRPDLIGQAVSNGCIRVPNDQLERLFDRTLSGTPVVVRT